MTSRRPWAVLAVASLTAAGAADSGSGPARPAGAEFRAHTIATGLTGGYQVVVADLNRDGRPDVIALASDVTQLRWYQNPRWEPHLLVSGIRSTPLPSTWTETAFRRLRSRTPSRPC